jgi:mannose-6-phosphate isomerase-like protein (cupin superfamily)
MKKLLLLAILVSAPCLGVARPPEPQAKAAQAQPGAGELRPQLVVLKAGEPARLTYDAGTARFLVPGEATHGAWALVELQEMPAYHTNLHRHNHTDEAFYVLDGVLTVNIDGSTSDYPAGSYILIPRRTPHAQGNRGKVPARILVTMTPAGFERSFKDRVELFKTTKPTDPDFRKKRKANAASGNYDVEFLANWSLPK